eukprot:scaffold189328_cov44-Tisochrysis_lutea.AAC.2
MAGSRSRWRAAVRPTARVPVSLHIPWGQAQPSPPLIEAALSFPMRATGNTLLGIARGRSPGQTRAVSAADTIATAFLLGRCGRQQTTSLAAAGHSSCQAVASSHRARGGACRSSP